MNEQKLVLSPAEEAVMMRLWEKGRDGNEHLAHLRGDVLLNEADGDDGSVRFEHDYSATKILRGDTIAHNHPLVLNSFSNQDIYNGAYFGTKSLVITEDKSIYSVRPIATLETIETFWELSNILISGVTRDAFKEAGVLHCEHDCHERFATNGAHYVNLLLAKQGLIEYSYRLAEKTEAIVSAVREVALNNVRRKT